MVDGSYGQRASAVRDACGDVMVAEVHWKLGGHGGGLRVPAPGGPTLRRDAGHGPCHRPRLDVRQWVLGRQGPIPAGQDMALLHKRYVATPSFFLGGGSILSCPYL